MDPIDILGSLLGGRSGGGGGLGTKILKDMLGGAAKRAQQPRSAPQRPAPQHPSAGGGATFGRRGGSALDELEDLLNVARDRSSVPDARRVPAPQLPTPRAPQTHEHRHERPSSSSWDAPLGNDQCPRPPQDQNEQAVILIRAMVNAAKADGKITREEQQNLVNQLGSNSPQALRFLQDEFSKPLDVREFAWTVPIGMEEQVYSMSLAAIDLDSNPEASYLRQLAHGLRLSPDDCNQIHRQYGAPPLYS